MSAAILIVDDNKKRTQKLETIIGALPFTVITTDNEEKAFDIMIYTEVSVLLFDYSLVGSNVKDFMARIYDVMNDLNLFPENNESKTQLLFINFGENEAAHCLKLLVNARANGINAELYPDNAKTGKQMNYANDKKIPFVAFLRTSKFDGLSGIH